MAQQLAKARRRNAISQFLQTLSMAEPGNYFYGGLFAEAMGVIS